MLPRSDLRIPTILFQQLDNLFPDDALELTFEQFLTSLSLTEAEFRDPQCYIDGNQLMALLRLIEGTSKLTHPVLDGLQSFSAGNLGAAGLVGLNSFDLQQLLVLFQKFYPYFMPTVTLNFIEKDEEIWIDAEFASDFEEMGYLIMEFFLCGVKKLADELAYKPWPAIIELKHKRNRVHKVDTYLEDYNNFLNCEVKFGCEQYRMRWPKKSLSFRLKSPNSAIQNYAENLLIEQVESFSRKDSIAKKAKQKVFTAAKQGHHMDLAALADEFYMSPRTLSRKLAKENTSFKDLLSDVRIRNAKELLSKTDLQVKCVARKVGYQNSDAFSRAFKTQTGFSPAQWKQTQATV